MSEPKLQDKPFQISKWTVWEAFQRVRGNKGRGGRRRAVDYGVRAGSGEEPVSDLESTVIGQLPPAAGESGGNPQSGRQGRARARRADRG
jgi:hypothetical protein